MDYSIIGIIGVIVILVIWFIVSYNGFVKLKTNVEEGFSTMDVYLKKRFDLIPNIVESVKGYAKHEEETLANVISARNSINSANSINSKISAENMLTDAIGKLFALAEAYPDLKANQNFLHLQDTLNQTELEIANSRKYYNAVVATFNKKCGMFPSVLVAKLFGFKEFNMFETNQASRENVKVSF